MIADTPTAAVEITTALIGPALGGAVSLLSAGVIGAAVAASDVVGFTTRERTAWAAIKVVVGVGAETVRVGVASL